MTEIPDDIRKAAREAAIYIGADSLQNATETIALAILGERERCAKVAECHSDDRPRRYDMDWNDGYIDGCRGAASAIRGNPPGFGRPHAHPIPSNPKGAAE